MFRLARSSILGAMVLVVGLSIAEDAQAAQADMVNGNNKIWIFRRNKTDPNKNGDIAIALKIERVSDTEVEGHMYVWSGENGATYTNRRTYKLNKATVSSPGQSNRVLEKVRFVGTAAGLPNINVYASLYKGKDKTNGNAGRAQKRIVVRYKQVAQVNPGDGCGQNAPVVDDCEEEPNEDVLEEEVGIDPPLDPPYDP